MERAILAADGTLRGFEPIKGKARPGDVTVPDGCTLEPGRYRWDGSAFQPFRPPTHTRDQALFATANMVREAIANNDPAALRIFEAYVILKGDE